MLKIELTKEYIRHAYLMLLDRDVESEEVLEWLYASAKSFKDLRTIILNSPEFRQKNIELLREETLGNKPPMEIQQQYTKEELDLIFAHIQNSWQKLGKTEPHWSVLSAPAYKKESIIENIDSFYESGKGELQLILDTFSRNLLDLKQFKTCLEFGCGLGRTTRWLGQKFDVVYGYDISNSHLSLAEEYIAQRGQSNIELRQLISISDLTNMPKADFVFSVIVLQHNPPPIIKITIEALLGLINPGGVALFQVPVYRKDYKFSVKKYLNNIDDSGGIEMHVIPQSEVFKIVRNMNCEVLEVVSDHYAGEGTGIFSNTFLIRRM
jgi:2-polyprenyl-3-methyl-5-hydroxy-6-metoxy-1,4-benzoquinol methylase